jgi:hypothetical protein
VEGIRVDFGFRRIKHYFIARQLDRSRVDLFVALGREFARELGNESNGVIWHLPAVEKRYLGG